MTSILRPLRAAAAALALLGAALGCSIDEDVIENKPCGGTDNKQCIPGYECKCEYGKCICVRGSSLSSSLWSSGRGSYAAGPAAAPLRSDPSRALLERLGVRQP
jgi:hypothetical protein